MILKFFDIVTCSLLFVWIIYLFLFHSSKECVMLIDLDLQGHCKNAIFERRVFKDIAEMQFKKTSI